MLRRAVLELGGPVAVRYPRGGEGRYTGDAGDEASVILRQGTDITLVGYGIQINDLLEAAEKLQTRGISAEVIKLNTITPIAPELVLESVRKTGALLAAEDSVASGSVGHRLAAALEGAGVPARLCLLNSGDSFVAHGAVSRLKAELYLDSEGIMKKGLEVLERG